MFNLIEKMKARNQRPIKFIYDLWQRSNYFKYAHFASAMGIIIMSFMMLFDLLFLGAQAPPFLKGRVVSLGVLFPGYLIAGYFMRTKAIQREQSLLVPTAVLLTPIMVFTVLYYYYAFHLDDVKFDVYYLGLLLVIFYCSFILHRFWVAQYTYCVVGILSTVAIMPFKMERFDSLLIVVIVHLVSLTIFAYFRKDFVGGLISRFNLLSTIVPLRFAELIVATSDSVSSDELFKPRGRFTVCLCADWRNFQKLTQKKTSQEVSAMLERYYDLLLVALNEKIPSNNYFFNWTADELFIVFFNDEDSREEVINDALKFARALADEIYEKIRAEFNGEVIYDIGISSGIGLLGLQGPTKMKKTTIAGEVAGQAKRFEEEAKHLRSSKYPSAHPIVILDEDLYKSPSINEFFDISKFEPIQASVKDVQGKACYLWCKDKRTTDLKRVA